MFLKINNMVGKNKLRDTFFYICGQYLIWVLILINIFLFPVGLYAHEMVGFLGLFFCATFLAYGVSYLIALRIKHPRPIVEFPHIKELIVPLSTWKSFPSDHTIAAVILATSAMFLSGAPEWSFLFFSLAALVMAGRIYCGVHYPRDIVGGIVVALCAMMVTVLLFAIFMNQFFTCCLV